MSEEKKNSMKQGWRVGEGCEERKKLYTSLTGALTIL